MSVGYACRTFLLLNFFLILKKSNVVRGHRWNMATCIAQYVAYVEIKYVKKGCLGSRPMSKN
jgi:hypothetical protein